MPAQSKQQQKFMGMVHALKKGEMDPKDASPELKKAAQSMDDKSAKDFASTPHKGLPKKVRQEIINRLKEYANKMGTDHLGGDDYTSSKKGGLRDNDGYDNVDYNKDMSMDESNLKGQLAGDSVQDVIKSIGSRFVSGEIKNTKRDGKTYLKLTDEKFGSGVVKILKSRFGIDAKIDYYGGKGKVASSPSVSFFSDNILEGKLPNNWMSGRTSDYHTQLRGKKREYDDTNFKKDNSGQPDLEESFNELEHLKLLNLAMKTMPGSPKQKEIIKKLNKVRVAGGMKPLKEGDLEDVIHQVKKFDKPKDQKLLTIKVINKLKDKRNKSNSSSNKEKLQKMIDKIESDYKKGKFLTEAPIFHTMSNPRFKKATKDLVKNKKVKNPDTGQDVQLTTALKDKDHPAHNQAKSLFQRLKSKLVGEYASNQTLSYIPADEEEIEKMNEGTMIRRAVDIAQELLPKDTWSRFAADGKKNAEFVKNVVRDLTQSLNRFYKNHNISVRIKEEEGDSNVDMVLGVLSILRQIEDKENRQKVAVDMIKKFKEQNIDFDYKEFLELMKEYNK